MLKKPRGPMSILSMAPLPSSAAAADAADLEAAAVIDRRGVGLLQLDEHVARQRAGARQLGDAHAAEQPERGQPALALEHRVVAHRVAGLDRQLAANQLRSRCARCR